MADAEGLWTKRVCGRQQFMLGSKSSVEGAGQKLAKPHAAGQHSDFAAVISEHCRKCDAHSRKIADSVQQIPEGLSLGGWSGVMQKLRRVARFAAFPDSNSIPTYLATMYNILEDAKGNPAKTRREEEFEQLKDFRSKVYELAEDAIGRRHEAKSAQVEWEEEMLPVWKQKCQDVEVEENHLALLQAICMTCDVIWQQKDKLLAAQGGATSSTAAPFQSDTIEDSDSEEDQTRYAHSSDAYRERQKLPDEELRRVHPASQKHGMEGHQCKPCHFPPGQCWQGNQCPYCHICEKPKRKSKTQRLVAKRRQERYKLIESTGNSEALQAVKTVDEARRKFISSSDNLKQELKDKLLEGDSVERKEAEQKLQKLSDLMAGLDEIVPDGLSRQEFRVLAPGPSIAGTCHTSSTTLMQAAELAQLSWYACGGAG